MTVKELANNINSEILAGNNGVENEVTCGYCGDLLSWVMGRAKENSAWVTVMGNVNAVAVAVLADISCIVLAENSPLDEDAKVKADEHDIPILRTDIPQYELCVAIDRLLK